MNYQLVFRSPFGQITAGVIAFLALAFCGMIWASDGFTEMLIAAPLPLGLAYFTWWVWAWPAVYVDRRGIKVQNQVRTFRISWAAMIKAEPSFGLYLYTRDEEELPGGGEERIRGFEDAAGTDLRDSSASATQDAAGGLNSAGDAPASARVPGPANLRGELTIGEVDPVSLDPDDLGRRKPIYVAGVPARGGIKSAARKELPSIPTLDLTSRNRAVLRAAPLVVARLLNEEQYYLKNPTERPEVHRSREDLQVKGEEYRGVSTSFNYLQIGGFLAFAGYLATLFILTR